MGRETAEEKTEQKLLRRFRKWDLKAITRAMRKQYVVPLRSGCLFSRFSWSLVFGNESCMESPGPKPSFKPVVRFSRMPKGGMNDGTNDADRDKRTYLGPELMNYGLMVYPETFFRFFLLLRHPWLLSLSDNRVVFSFSSENDDAKL